jgi:dihydrofolate reductase
MIQNTKISLIAAIGKNRELGKNNDLIWKIPEDLKRFREKTRGHAIIMGRKTWESLPTKPLPGRYNIVITRDDKYSVGNLEKVTIARSLEEAVNEAKKVEQNEIFVIGGGQIFEQAISIADKLYLTIIDADFDADTFFPDYSAFKKVVFEKSSQEGEYKYKFMDLEK